MTQDGYCGLSNLRFGLRRGHQHRRGGLDNLSEISKLRKSQGGGVVTDHPQSPVDLGALPDFTGVLLGDIEPEATTMTLFCESHMPAVVGIEDQGRNAHSLVRLGLNDSWGGPRRPASSPLRPTFSPLRGLLGSSGAFSSPLGSHEVSVSVWLLA